MSILDFVQNSIVPTLTGGVIGGPTVAARTAEDVMAKTQLMQALREAAGGAITPNDIKPLLPNNWDSPEMRAQKQMRIQEIIRKMMTMKKPINVMPTAPRSLTPEMMTPPDIMEVIPETGRPMPPRTVRPPRLGPTYQPPAGPFHRPQFVSPYDSPDDMKRDYELQIRMLEERIRNLETQRPQTMEYQGTPDYRVRTRTLEKRLPEPVTAGSFSNY